MTRLGLTAVWLALLTVPATARADGKSKAAREAAEYVLQRFGRGAAKEGTQALAKTIEVAAARHGADVFEAVKKVGPRAIPLVEQAGAHSAQAARAMAAHGERGAAWVVSRPSAMKLVARHGDDAARVLVKHAGGVAEPVVARFGAPAIRAMEATGPQAGRRVAMLMADGHLAKIGRTEEVLEVIAKYGDRGVKFVWENKAALATTAALATFLANPEPYISGTRDVAKVVGESVVRPVAEIPGQAVKGLLTGVNGVLVTLAAIAGAALLVFRGRSRVPTAAIATPPPPAIAVVPATPSGQESITQQPKGEERA